MTGAPLISVIIPTYQRCISVRRALLALSVQTLPVSDFEVIVSIDGSDDGTPELVAEFAAPYVLRGVWQSNAGRASACNRGITASRGRITVLLDDDMEPLPGCLQAHWRAHEGPQRRGVIGAVPVALNEQSGPAARYISEKFKRHGAKLAQPGYQIGFRDFYSGNLSVRHDVLVEVGLFDARFTVYGNEDSGDARPVCVNTPARVKHPVGVSEGYSRSPHPGTVMSREGANLAPFRALST